MKLFLDENLPISLIAELEKLGFAVEHARQRLRGAEDKKLATHAKKQQAILVTKDVEFGSLVLYPKGAHYGLIVLRVPSHFHAKQIVKTLRDFFEQIQPNDLIDKITVVEVGRYRMRTLS